MWELAAIFALFAITFAWVDGMKARERAVDAGRDACDRYQLQCVDDTVPLSTLSPATQGGTPVGHEATAASAGRCPAAHGLQWSRWTRCQCN